MILGRFLLASALAAGTGAAAAAPAAAPRYNVVLIVVDGLRADHLPTYGYGRQTAPNLTRRAASAVIFDRAVAQATWTLPSFVSLFSSLYPEKHGVTTSRVVIPPKLPLLAQALRAAGMRTAAFVGGHYLDPVYGFARGFDLYRAAGLSNFRSFRETAPQAADWLRAQGDARFFVVVHGNDLHPPFDMTGQGERMRHAFDAGYSGPVDSLLIDYTFVQVFNGQPFTAIGVRPDDDYLAQVAAVKASPRDLEHIAAHYDGQILDVDRALETVFSALEKTGRDRDTIVVLTGDHGLEWGGKGKLATAFHATQYDSVIHVPLLIWVPGLRPRRVAQPVELVDLAPTLLELLGLPAQPSFQGRSLAALASGRARPDPRRLAFSSSELMNDPPDRLLMHSVQDRRWKLVYDVLARTRRLYDLEKDPKENSDVAASQPAQASRLLKALTAHLGGKLP